jgi:hypothetical protein
MDTMPQEKRVVFFGLMGRDLQGGSAVLAAITWIKQPMARM